MVLNRFRFDDESSDSIGITTLYLGTSPGIRPIPNDTHIMSADIPPILGMVLLDGEQITTDVAL